MDARERLRRYLEQRRELGESELVLDTIPVDDVLRLIGARTRGARSVAGERATIVQPDAGHAFNDERAAVDTSAAAQGKTPAEPPPAPAAPAPPPTPVMRTGDVPVTSDWRTALADTQKQAPPAGAKSTAPPVKRVESTAAPHNTVSSVAIPSSAIPAWLAALDVPFGMQSGAETLRAHVTRLDQLIADLPSLDAIAHAVAGCTRCPLYATAINPVPGEGNPDADFVCVGEAPGQTEDEQGRPFVGAAGQLLTKILGAIKLSREDVFICNVLKHRPPGNRDPMPDEVHACSPYLLRQLDLIRPKVILALGSFAARTLLGTDQTIGRLRGRVHFYHGIPLVATYHPAALLRNESWKRPAWEDVQLARRIYDAARASATTSS